MDCRESGSTLRFLLPVLAARAKSPVTVTGCGRLPERPIDDLLATLRDNGANIDGDALPLTVHGGLRPGTFFLPGNVSSQYISGLLFALPLLDDTSEIRLTTPLESASYISLTLEVLDKFGIFVIQTMDRWHIPGNQEYHSPGTFQISGDWSSAAMWLAAGIIGTKPVTVTGLRNAGQGDRAIVDVLRKLGARIEQNGDAFTAFPSSLHGGYFDVRDIPDLLPVLAVVATAARPGEQTILGNAARLRLKESDRLSTVATLLRTLGGQVEELPDALVITGGPLHGGVIDAANDHRIVMAAALAARVTDAPVQINGFRAVAKSYPAFLNDLQKLGGSIHVI